MANPGFSSRIRCAMTVTMGPALSRVQGSSGKPRVPLLRGRLASCTLRALRITARESLRANKLFVAAGKPRKRWPYSSDFAAGRAGEGRGFCPTREYPARWMRCAGAQREPTRSVSALPPDLLRSCCRRHIRAAIARAVVVARQDLSPHFGAGERSASVVETLKQLARVRLEETWTPRSASSSCL
jgi:hypothetical protein